jgi:sugar diacid utilization regulator
MTNALAPRHAAPGRRPGGGLHSTATRARRGGAATAPRGTRAYRLCLLSWAGGEPTEALIERLRQAAFDWDGNSRLVSVGRGAQALLIPEDSRGGPSRERLSAAVDSVVEAVRAVQPNAELHAVVGDRITSLEQLRVVAARLRLLARYAGARGGDEVVWGQRYSLACLLQTLDPRQASAFVEGQLATVRAYDREHGTNLQRVLELALDHENRNKAARAAFMHRNTFRRQFSKALALIDVDLACPEERLALHVALKMRSLVSPLRLGERLARESDSWTRTP